MLHTNFAKFGILLAISTMLNACSAQTSAKQSGQVNPNEKKHTPPQQNMTDKEKERLRQQGKTAKTTDTNPKKKESPKNNPTPASAMSNNAANIKGMFS